MSDNKRFHCALVGFPKEYYIFAESREAALIRMEEFRAEAGLMEFPINEVTVDVGIAVPMSTYAFAHIPVSTLMFSRDIPETQGNLRDAMEFFEPPLNDVSSNSTGL